MIETWLPIPSVSVLRSGFSSASAQHDQPIEWLQTVALLALPRSRKAGVVLVRSYGVLSTCSPAQCRLATFTGALVDALTAPGEIGFVPVGFGRHPTVGVVAVVDRSDPALPPEVAYQWERSDHRGAAALNRFDIAIIQHEYGIYSGRDGVDIIETVRALRIPAIVLLHIMLVTPTPQQRMILEQLTRSCAAVVTMTNTARRRLIDHYAADPGLAARMGAEAKRIAPELLWTSVGRKYRNLAVESLRADTKLATA